MLAIWRRIVRPQEKVSGMRLWISALLLASAAAVPAYAQDRSDWRQGGGHERGNHQNGGGQPAGGGHQGGNPGAPRPAPAPQAQVPQNRPPAAQPGNNGGARAPGGWQQGGGHHGNDARPGAQPGGGRPDNHGWDHGNNGNNGGWQGRPNDPGRSGNWDRGHQGGNRNDGRNNGGWNNGHASNGAWNRGWRDDRRYDWRGWRDSHRSYYRVDRYRPPYGYGYGYRRFDVGVRLDSVFFGSDYWITNPDYYRLPPAYGPYRWVRYYNDALLVDVRTGYVMDSIPDFFYY